MDIYVTELKVEDDVIKCYADDDVSAMAPKAHMIVDSDDAAFIYLVDREGDNRFSCVHFVHETWSILNDYYGRKVIVNNHLELEGIFDELDFLLDNIKDNNNYGKDFEGKVVAAFNL